MKKELLYFLIGTVIVFLLIGCVSNHFSNSNTLDPENTYLILIEKNNYSSEYSNLNVNFTNSHQLRDLFLLMRVPEENIFSIEDEVGEQEIHDSFTWVRENASADATIFYYVAAHGRYLRKALRWNFLVPPQWKTLVQKNKIMIIDSCNAGEFVSPFKDDEKSGLTYGVVSADELNWWGEEFENLPVVGSIWIHYFIVSVRNPDVDRNGDEKNTFTEAHEYANAEVQKYMSQNVYSNPEFLSIYQDLGYEPFSKPAYPNAVMYNHLKSDIILYEFSPE